MDEDLGEDMVSIRFRAPRQMLDRAKALAKKDRRSRNAQLVKLVESALAARADGEGSRRVE